MDLKDKIACEAKKEFLKKGYLNASLRTITKNALVSTGAFYSKYENKDALFSYVVKDLADGIVKIFNEEDTKINIYDNIDFDYIAEFSYPKIKMIVDYIYDNYDNAVILFRKANGSSYENFIEKIEQLHYEKTIEYLNYNNFNNYCDKAIKVLMASSTDSIIKLIDYSLTKDEAYRYAEDIIDFYSVGFVYLISKEDKNGRR